jgi:hypothetical protein
MKNPGKTTIQKATPSYEKWLGEQIPLLPAAHQERRARSCAVFFD